MEIEHQFRWTTKLEELLAAEGEKCHGYAWLHSHAAERYAGYNSIITLPTIVLATLSGTASIGQSSLFNNSVASVIVIGLMSITAGVLNTINSYYAWAKRSESHRIAGVHYMKIFRFISVEMSLPRESRMSPKDFVKIIREQIDRLGEVSPMIPKTTRDEFRVAFLNEDNSISRPEICNGLEKITIYTHDDELNSMKDLTREHPSIHSINWQPPAANAPQYSFITSNVYKPMTPTSQQTSEPTLSSVVLTSSLATHSETSSSIPSENGSTSVLTLPRVSLTSPVSPIETISESTL